MSQQRLTRFHFEPQQLNYAFLAWVIRDWLLAVRDAPGEFSSAYGNEEGFKATLKTLAEGFEELADDNWTEAGPGPLAELALETFGDIFTTLWRV